jgi:ornithine carbamoyltransferase
VTRHLLEISDLSSDQLRSVLALCASGTRPLEGEGVALIFEKPSNRTRHSMEMAVVALGGHPVYTRGEEIGFDVRESVEDATRILSGYHRVLAARVFDHATLGRMSAVAAVPVVNMLSDRSHPLQALADVVTMVEAVGAIDALEVAWVGDYNNVARSLSEAVCLLGGSMRLGGPPGHQVTAEEVTRLSQLGGSVSVHASPEDTVTGAHVVHTDTWTSMGQESEADARREAFEGWTVDAVLMSRARPGARFMHCMPVHRGEEVSADVMDSGVSLAVRQGHHRLTAARGALRWVLGEDA